MRWFPRPRRTDSTSATKVGIDLSSKIKRRQHLSKRKNSHNGRARRKAYFRQLANQRFARSLARLPGKTDLTVFGFPLILARLPTQWTRSLARIWRQPSKLDTWGSNPHASVLTYLANRLHSYPVKTGKRNMLSFLAVRIYYPIASFALAKGRRKLCFLQDL